MFGNQCLGRYGIQRECVMMFKPVERECVMIFRPMERECYDFDSGWIIDLLFLFIWFFSLL